MDKRDSIYAAPGHSQFGVQQAHQQQQQQQQQQYGPGGMAPQQYAPPQQPQMMQQHQQHQHYAPQQVYGQSVEMAQFSNASSLPAYGGQPMPAYVAQPVYIQSPPTAQSSLYDVFLPRYKAMNNALMGLAVTQMVIWFPLGFLYFIGLMPRRGRLQMGMGILFFLLSMAGFITLVSLDWLYCSYYYDECFIDDGFKFVAFIFTPHIALSAASIGVGAHHRKLELAMRVADFQRFAHDYPARATSGSVHQGV